MHESLISHLLDTSEDLENFELQKDKILKHFWDLYSDLAYQRHKISDQLKNSLLEAATGPYEFSGWQRQVKYKYSLIPLSPKGSLIEPGGRFNVPNMDSIQISPFPALYIAKDKETVLQEAGQSGYAPQGLSSLDLALVRKNSISIVSIGGKLDLIIDLHNPQTLQPFLNLIKKFSISKKIIASAKEIGIKAPKIARKLDSLIENLLEPNWRAWCMQFDIPANCQIFGQLVASAKIEGILYPSKFTKKQCLAIYPQNFDSDSFVAIEDDVPEGTMSRLDCDIWKKTFQV